MSVIINILKSLRDAEYANFMRHLIPNIPPNSILGVRTIELRKLAKEYDVGEAPHQYFEENQIHAFSIANETDFDRCLERLEAFLPYIDNWATCDQLSPKIFRTHREGLLPHIDRWLNSDHTYTVRFAVGMLMEHYLDEDFDVKYLDKVTSIRSEEYYIRMMVAWYIATALAKQWDATLPYLENDTMDVWTHNKSIQKATESFRVSDTHKEYLRTLRRRENKSAQTE